MMDDIFSTNLKRMQANSHGILHRRNFSSATAVKLHRYETRQDILHKELRRLLITNNENNKNTNNEHKSSNDFDCVCSVWRDMVYKQLPMGSSITSIELNVTTALLVSVARNDFGLVRKLCSNYNGNPSLILTERGETGLILAAKNGDAGMMDLLVKYGFDIENKINDQDCDERTVIHHASLYNGRGSDWHVIEMMFKFLLKYKKLCNFLKYDLNGYLPFHYLCKYDRSKALKYLIDNKIYDKTMILNRQTKLKKQKHVKSKTQTQSQLKQQQQQRQMYNNGRGYGYKNFQRYNFNYGNDNSKNYNYNVNSMTMGGGETRKSCIMITVEERSLQCLKLLCNLANNEHNINVIVTAAIRQEQLKYCVKKGYSDILQVLLSTLDNYTENNKLIADLNDINNEDRKTIVSFELLSKLIEFATQLDNCENNSCIALLARWLKSKKSNWKPQHLYLNEHNLITLTNNDIQIALKISSQFGNNNSYQCIVCSKKFKDFDIDTLRLNYCAKCRYYICDSCTSTKSKNNNKKVMFCLLSCFGFFIFWFFWFFWFFCFLAIETRVTSVRTK